jgi:integrase
VPRPPLTDLSIKRLPVPAAGTLTYWDALKGFGIRVSSGGTRTFIVLIGPGRRQSIGHYPLVSLSDARTEARRILAERTLGRVRPTHTAYDDALRDYLTECEKKNRSGTVKEYRRILTSHFPFGRQSVGDIGPRDILRKLGALSDRPSEKHHAYVALRAFLRWCARQHLIDRSPMENMSPPPAGASRERALTEDELRAVYKTARDGTTYFHGITALLVLTGQRKNEIAHLKWDWIEDGLVNLPSSLTKNTRPHTFPIGNEAQAILTDLPRFEGVPFVFPAERQRSARTTVFNGWGKPKQRFDKECGISGWQLRDLRRTVSTYMAELQVPQLHVEKLLNHVSGGTQSPIAQVYNRYSYLEEMREAVLKWEAYLGTLLDAR